MRSGCPQGCFGRESADPVGNDRAQVGGLPSESDAGVVSPGTGQPGCHGDTAIEADHPSSADTARRGSRCGCGELDAGSLSRSDSVSGVRHRVDLFPWTLCEYWPLSGSARNGEFVAPYRPAVGASDEPHLVAGALAHDPPECARRPQGHGGQMAVPATRDLICSPPLALMRARLKPCAHGRSPAAALNPG
jgi:hypothetical protein